MTAQAQPEGEIVVVVESQDRKYSYDQLGLSFESTDQEVLDAVQPVILEDTGINIFEDDESLYAVKRTEESQTTYVFPKSQAG